MSIQNVISVINAVRKNNGFIIDDHAPCDVAYRPKHLGVMRTPDRGEIVVPIFEHQEFPMTPIELDHAGRPHMVRETLKRIFNTKVIEANDLAGHEPDMIVVIDV